METSTIIVAVIVLLLAAVFIFLLYSGLFYTYTIRCTIPASLPQTFAYSVHIGPYDKVCYGFDQLKLIAPRRRLFTAHYDDPKEVKYQQFLDFFFLVDVGRYYFYHVESVWFYFGGRVLNFPPVIGLGSEFSQYYEIGP